MTTSYIKVDNYLFIYRYMYLIAMHVRTHTHAIVDKPLGTFKDYNCMAKLIDYKSCMSMNYDL